MRFRLIYKGPLKSRNSANKDDKQAIRRSFHEQLKNLWNHEPLVSLKEEMTEVDLEKQGALVKQIGNFKFVPLVSSLHGWNTVATIEFLLLRDAIPGDLINHGGDIDNRLKVLFDALRMPSHESELPSGDKPLIEENPFYVLLEDDSLVTAVTVITDRLLKPVDTKNYVEIIASVSVSVTRASWNNIGIGA